MEGFVLIQTEFGRADDVARGIAALDSILTVEAVTGAYDVVARARRNSGRELVRCLEEEIASIPGVTRVLVCPLASHARIWELGTERIWELGPERLAMAGVMG
jgi:DNA-binding Lrp family transcriptional regulator